MSLAPPGRAVDAIPRLRMQIAQINVARAVAPLDDPRLSDFIAQLDQVNMIAESSPGFVWRLKAQNGEGNGYVPIGHRPSVADALERPEVLERVGPTQEAFTFKVTFGMPSGSSPTFIKT
jgi:hypothetical protein